MTKNMTRKGLALGAASALLISGFSALPASSAGLADTSFVSLAPSAGSEYSVLADDTSTGAIFTLTANEAATVSIGDLKFLVTDASGLVEPTLATTGNLFSLANADTLDATTGELITINSATLAAQVVEGSIIHFPAALTTPDNTTSNTDAGTDPDIAVAAGAEVVVTDVTGTAVQFTTATTIGETGAAEAITDGIFVEILRGARNTVTNTYIVNSNTSDATVNETLVLESDSLLTRSVTVQAWMDANDNDVIDSTEYSSPVRTVQWIKASEVVASTSLTYPTPGDTSLTATVTLTPNLNEQQSMSAGDVKIGFTRPGSTATVAANATQNDTTRVWSASVPLDSGNWAGMPHVVQVAIFSERYLPVHSYRHLDCVSSTCDVVYNRNRR